MIEVEVIDYMGDDLTIVNAARVSYGSESNQMTERDEGLINFLADHNHVTPFRHTAIQVRCKAPIFLARQLGKHQVGFSWNEISRRYKDGEAIPVEFFIPTIVFERPEKLMKDTAQPASLEMEKAFKDILLSSYKSSLKDYKRLLALGATPEQARMILPQGMMTEWIWTGLLYGFYSLWKQRADPHAQYEARLFASKIGNLMEELFPKCWAALTKQKD